MFSTNITVKRENIQGILTLRSKFNREKKKNKKLVQQILRALCKQKI